MFCSCHTSQGPKQYDNDIVVIQFNHSFDRESVALCAKKKSCTSKFLVRAWSWCESLNEDVSMLIH